MTSKTLSPQALAVIDGYLRFRIGEAVCSVPYFNNKTVRARAALAVNVGKGSPDDIKEDIRRHDPKNHVDVASITDSSLGKLMADHNVGIDASGLAYYILSAESESLGKGPLDGHLHFIRAHGFFGRFITNLNPVKNTDVDTLADDRNSRIIPLIEAQPGDMITMTGGPENGERDHILVVHQIDYAEGADSVPTKLYYSTPSLTPPTASMAPE